MKRQISPWLILVFGAVIWQLIYVYWTPVVERYMVPPGDDAAVHIQGITELLSGQWSLFGANGYPHGFHIVMALIAKLTGLSALLSVLWFTPLLLVAPIFVIYYVGKKLFDNALVGAVAAGAWVFIALAPIRAFGDGNYPNLVASSILMPLCLLWLYRLTSAPSLKKTVPVVISLVLLALVHHLTLVYLIAVTVPWLIITTAEKAWELRHQKGAVRIVMTGLLIMVFAMGVFWFLYGKILAPYIAVVKAGGNLAHYLGGDSSTLSILQILEINHPVLIILGLVGLLALMLSRLERSLKLLFASWILVLFALGAVPIVGLPGRFVRELAIPCSLLIGYLALFLYQHSIPKVRDWLIPLFVVVVLGAVWLDNFAQPFALPDPFKPLMRMQHEEEPAIPVLQNFPTETVIATNSNPFLPYLLVNKRVIIIRDPGEVSGAVKNYPTALLYLAKQPPLSEGYPFFALAPQIFITLDAVPSKKLIQTLANGSKVYQLIPPAAKSPKTKAR